VRQQQEDVSFSSREEMEVNKLTAEMQSAWEKHVERPASSPPDFSEVFGAGFVACLEMVGYRQWLAKLSDGRYLVFFDEGNGWWSPVIMLPPMPPRKAVAVARRKVAEMTR